jgi:hypothetical protein
MVVAAGLLVWPIGPSLGPAVQSATASAVQSARLQIRGVHRGPGGQVVTAQLTVDPPPSRRVTATVTVVLGDTRVSFDGTIGRRGRLFARARRLDLTGALAAFDGARVEISGPIDGLALFATTDCTRTARSNTITCRARGVVDAPPDAVYDADVDVVVSGTHESLPHPVASLMTLTAPDRELAVQLDDFDSFALEGPLENDPTSMLDGYAIFGGDIYAVASGTATAAREAGGWRIDGVAASAPFGSTFSWAFVLRRPDAGTPAAFGGTWTVDLIGFGLNSLVGHVPLALTVPADGHATTDPAVVVDDNGASIYELSAGTCSVAPAGAVVCHLPAGGVFAIVLQGRVSLADGTGRGEFFVGSPPSIFTEGTWSATRSAQP